MLDVLVSNQGDLKIFVDHMEVDCLKGVIKAQAQALPCHGHLHFLLLCGTTSSRELSEHGRQEFGLSFELNPAKSRVSQNSIL